MKGLDYLNPIKWAEERVEERDRLERKRFESDVIDAVMAVWNPASSPKE